MKYLTTLMDCSSQNRLAFLFFLASGSFAILLWSPNVIGSQINSTIKIIIYALPWIMLWPTYHLEVICRKTYRVEIILMIIIIILGALNVIYSDNPQRSLSTMRNFILSGLLATWISMFLMVNQQRKEIFDWFCCGCLVIIATIEITLYLHRVITNIGPIYIFMRHHILDYPGQINIFALDPIPTGTLMILLSTGPVHLILSKSSKNRLIGYGSAILGVLLILLSQKRGTIMAVAAIALAMAFYRSIRVRYLVGVALLAAALLIPSKGVDWFKSLNPQLSHHASLLHRFELYPFALHVWQQHPFMGTGLRPINHEKYLESYQQYNPRLDNFPADVKKLQTFDNMLITSFVELGTIMTLVYLAFIILIINKYWIKLHSYKQCPKEDLYRLFVLLGFAVHSMTYDSLLFPSINWLFHVHLGILIGYPGAAESTDIPPLSRA